MRITTSKLRQIIREELAGSAAESSRTREEDLGPTEDKMFNSIVSIEGLEKSELDSIKSDADLSIGDEGFFVINNASEHPVQVILADFGKSPAASQPFEISPRTRSKFIGFSKEALTRQTRSGRVLITGKHAVDGFGPEAYTTIKLVRPGVADMIKDEDYAGVLVKLTLSTGRVETPSKDEEEPPVAVTKTTTYMTPELVAAVSKQPLQTGSKGNNVKIVQRAIKAALQRFMSLREEFDITQNEATEIRRYVPSVDKDASSKQMLTALVSALKDDGDFGNITKTAVKIYQSRANISVDGRVGKETAESLQTENMSINESIRIINRWNKLAGLLKD